MAMHPTNNLSSGSILLLRGGSSTHCTALLSEDSFMFSSHFILVRVVVVPEPILGIQPGWDASPSQALHAHVHTLIQPSGQFNVANPLAGMFSKNTREPRGNPGGHGKMRSGPFGNTAQYTIVPCKDNIKLCISVPVQAHNYLVRKMTEFVWSPSKTIHIVMSVFYLYLLATGSCVLTFN